MIYNGKQPKREKVTILECILIVLLCISALFILWQGRIKLREVNEVAIKTIAYEASGESQKEGQVMVASVIKTRMFERGQTVSEVCLAKSQFSCWKDGKPTQGRVILPSERESARKAWCSAKKGIYNHYARYDCKPYWIKYSKSSKRVGNHVFYEL